MFDIGGEISWICSDHQDLNEFWFEIENMLVTILEWLKQISSDLTFEAYSDEDDKENYNNQN